MQILHVMVKDFGLLFAEFQITHTTLHAAAVHEITTSLDLALLHAKPCVQTSPAPKIFRKHTCFCLNKN